MKKYFWMLGSLLMSLAVFTSCSLFDDDEDEVKTEMEKNYFRVENASYVEGAMPQATIEYVLTVEVATETPKGGTNVIRIAKDKDYRRFFIGAKGVEGYWVYTPSAVSSVKTETRADEDENWDDFYEIVIDNSNGNVDNYTIVVSGEDAEGEVTAPFEQEINYTDAATGDKPTKIYVSMYGGNYTLFTMKYDNDGRMTYFASWDEDDDGKECIDADMAIDYKAKTITERMYDGESYEKWTYKYTTNSWGYITKMTCDDGEVITFSYSNEGYPMEMDVDGDVYRFSWSDGNLVSMSGTGDKRTATYGTDVNVNGQVTVSTVALLGEEAFLFSGLCGKLSKNLPTSLRATSVGDEGFEYSSITYTFNSNKSVATETINGMAKIGYGYGTRSADETALSRPKDVAAKRGIGLRRARRLLHQHR